MTPAQGVLGTSRRLRPGRHGPVTTLQAGGEPEAATLAGHTVGAGIAPHQTRQPARDRQAEAGTTV